MGERGIQESIEQLLHEGKIDEEYDPESDELQYSLTGQGMDYVERKVKEDDNFALHAFTSAYNMSWEEGESDDEAVQRLVKIAEWFRDNFDRNLFRLLDEHGDKVDGLSIDTDELPDDFVEKFDPDEGDAGE